jgi:hypothetical protein
MVTLTAPIILGMKPSRRTRRAMRLIVVGLMVAALAREMSMPPERRRWQGRLLGIPYSFRFPTPQRLRRAYWNPGDPRLFTERPFGIGWAINLARAEFLMQRGFRRLMGPPAPGAAGLLPNGPAAQSARRSLTKASARP